MICRKQEERKVQILGLVAAGLAWPTIYGAISSALASPLERALATSWCGATPHGLGAALLGHCGTCWTGSAAFLIAAAIVTIVSRPRFRLAAA